MNPCSLIDLSTNPLQQVASHFWAPSLRGTHFERVGGAGEFNGRGFPVVKCRYHTWWFTPRTTWVVTQVISTVRRRTSDK